MIDKEAGERAVAARRAREDRIVLSRAALALGAVFVECFSPFPAWWGPMLGCSRELTLWDDLD